MKTPLEIASSGLRLNKTKKLALCWTRKGRGVTTQEPIKVGEYVCEYKYLTCYPLRERKEWDKEYECNSEGCYVLEVVAGGKKLCLDATVNLNSYGRYINHTAQRKANLKMSPPPPPPEGEKQVEGGISCHQRHQGWRRAGL